LRPLQRSLLSAMSWHRGEPLQAARSIFEVALTDAIMQISSLGSGNTRRGILVCALDYSTFEISLVDTANFSIRLF
jgi:prolyl oligopeptidase